ncbi:hypothetical protein [Streptomyces sp. SAS_270]
MPRAINRRQFRLLDGGGNVSEGSVAKQWAWGNSTNMQWTVSPV